MVSEFFFYSQYSSLLLGVPYLFLVFDVPLDGNPMGRTTPLWAPGNGSFPSADMAVT